tara:strand:- start:7042 stop:7716 length:675 start_codon:yes stop_codon:yes gene_type:complete
MTPENISESQFNILKWLRLRSDWLVQYKPEDYNYLLGAATGEEFDVETMSPDESLHALLEAFNGNIDATSENLSMAQVPSPDVLVSQLESAMSINFTSRNLCNDWAALNYGEEPPCEYENPDGMGGGTSGDFDGWYSGEEDSSTWWQDVGNQALNVVNEIGWDVIGSWLFGGGDDDNDDNSTPPPVDENDNNDEEGTDWGKIALYGGITIVVGVGVYFLFRRKK